jgi:ATP-dependent Clp protease ATP-binding subunit ClpC
VDPPSPELAVTILKGLRENYESYHGVTITDEAIESAVQLSDRYLTDRFLPDKAIDLIDEAAACVRVASSDEGDARKLKSAEDELDKVRRKKQKAVVNENFIEALELKAREKELEGSIGQIKKQAGAKSKPLVGKIGRREVAAVIARATSIPLSDLMTEEKGRLLKLEEHIKARIVGQDDAVSAVAELVRRAKAGIAQPNRPLASFLFLGPSGVGKTELAKTLAETVFQDRDALVRIDMSEFAEGFNMSKLIGAPAGYVGYKEGTKLTDVIKRKPHALVLFDEIEKAHSEVHNLLLQLLEDGHITDATGRKINFKNSIIIMTSNVGAGQLLKPSIGFGSSADGEVTAADVAETKALMMRELENSFRPEFINRIDKVVVFQPLSKTALADIVKLQLGELAQRVRKDYRISMDFRPQIVAMLADKSWNPLYGARGVRRQIQDMVENPLAKQLLMDAYRPGDTVSVGLKNEAVVFAKRTAHARATAR